MRLISILFIASLTGCGVSDLPDETIGGGGIVDTEFTSKVQPILKKGCQGTGCHASSEDFIATGAGLKSSDAKNRLTDNSMPIPGTSQASAFSGADRTALLNYISGK